MKPALSTLVLLCLALASTGAQAKPVKLEFYQSKTEAVTVELFNQLVAGFNAENPGIIVEQNCVPNSKEILQTRMASRDVPAVFMHWPHSPDFWAMCNNGYVVDLSGDRMLANVIPAFLEQSRAFTKGKAYIVPYSLNTMGVIYNKKIFRDHGIAVPETYAELIAACKKLKAGGVTPFVFADKDLDTVDKHSKLITGLIIPDMQAYFDNLRSGKIDVTKDPAIRRVANKILELHQYGQENSLATSFDQGIADFVNGKAAMIMQGIWTYGTINKLNPGLEYEMFPFPADKKEDQRVPAGFDVAFGIAADAKNVPEAKKFVEYLTRPATAQKFATKDLSPSVIKGVEYEAKGYTRMVKYINEGKIYLWATAYWPAGITNDLRNAGQSLIVNKDVDAYLKEYQKIFDYAR